MAGDEPQPYEKTAPRGIAGLSLRAPDKGAWQSAFQLSATQRSGWRRAPALRKDKLPKWLVMSPSLTKRQTTKKAGDEPQPYEESTPTIVDFKNTTHLITLDYR